MTMSRTKPLTLTEQARRAQLIGVTIDLVARHGYAGTSLARIAEAAGLSKAAVLYHFPAKDAVIRAAYQTVIDKLTAEVGAAVEGASGAGALAAYIRALVGFLAGNPAYARMIIDAMIEDDEVTDTPNAPSRRQSVAALVEAAAPTRNPQTTAVIINGAIDAIVNETLTDPTFDAARAADDLVALVLPTEV